MKCPKCALITSNRNDICPRCTFDLRIRKRELGIRISKPKATLEELIIALETGTSATRKTLPQMQAERQQQSGEKPVPNVAPQSAAPSARQRRGLFERFFGRTEEEGPSAEDKPAVQSVPSAPKPPVSNAVAHPLESRGGLAHDDSEIPSENSVPSKRLEETPDEVPDEMPEFSSEEDPDVFQLLNTLHTPAEEFSESLTGSIDEAWPETEIPAAASPGKNIRGGSPVTKTLGPQVVEFDEDVDLEGALDALLGDAEMEVTTVAVPTEKPKVKQNASWQGDEGNDFEFNLEFDAEVGQSPESDLNQAEAAEELGGNEDFFDELVSNLQSLEAKASQHSIVDRQAPRAPSYAQAEPQRIQALQRAQEVMARLGKVDQDVLGELSSVLADAYGLRPETFAPPPSRPEMEFEVANRDEVLERAKIRERLAKFSSAPKPDRAQRQEVLSLEARLTGEVQALVEGGTNVFSVNELLGGDGPNSPADAAEIHALEPTVSPSENHLLSIEAELLAELEALQSQKAPNADELEIVEENISLPPPHSILTAAHVLSSQSSAPVRQPEPPQAQTDELSLEELDALIAEIEETPLEPTREHQVVTSPEASITPEAPAAEYEDPTALLSSELDALLAEELEGAKEMLIAEAPPESPLHPAMEPAPSLHMVEPVLMSEQPALALPEAALPPPAAESALLSAEELEALLEESSKEIIESQEKETEKPPAPSEDLLSTDFEAAPAFDHSLLSAELESLISEATRVGAEENLVTADDPSPSMTDSESMLVFQLDSLLSGADDQETQESPPPAAPASDSIDDFVMEEASILAQFANEASVVEEAEPLDDEEAQLSSRKDVVESVQSIARVEPGPPPSAPQAPANRATPIAAPTPPPPAAKTSTAAPQTREERLWDCAFHEINTAPDWRNDLEFSISAGEVSTLVQSARTDVLFESAAEEIVDPIKRVRRMNAGNSGVRRKVDARDLETAVLVYQREERAYKRTQAERRMRPARNFSEIPLGSLPARLFAFCVDVSATIILAAIVSILCIFPDAVRTSISLTQWPNLDDILPALFPALNFTFIVWLLVRTLGVLGYGSGLGGRMMKLEVVDYEGRALGPKQAFLRTCAEMTIPLTLGLSCLTVFGKTRRTLHDYLAKTLVAQRKELPLPKRPSRVMPKKRPQVARSQHRAGRAPKIAAPGAKKPVPPTRPRRT